jgi:hypothetical protein
LIDAGSAVQWLQSAPRDPAYFSNFFIQFTATTIGGLALSMAVLRR